MAGDKFVNTEDVEKILRGSIDQISKKAVMLSSFDQMPVIIDDSNIDEKDQEILDHISNNPGIIKERLLEAFEGKSGYSRRAFYRIIKKLEQGHMITVEPDKVNKRIHHLYINNYNIIISLLDELTSFNKAYFNLIDNLKRLEINLNATTERIQIVNAVTMPFRFFIIAYSIFNVLLSWHQTDLDKQTLHRKFAMVHRQVQNVHSKLSDALLNNGLIESADEISVEILQASSGVLAPETISTVLDTFDKYGLRENIELVLDCLWRISNPIIHHLYPYYSLKNPAVQKDWRRLIEEYERLPIPARRPNYRISKCM
jgi:hypothetical protein